MLTKPKARVHLTSWLEIPGFSCRISEIQLKAPFKTILIRVKKALYAKAGAKLTNQEAKMNQKKFSIVSGFIALFLFGSYAGAGKPFEVTEVKEGMATVKVPEGKEVSAGQNLYMKKKHKKRNGFFDLSVSGSYGFESEDFVLSGGSAYGGVLKCGWIPGGYLEGTVGIGATLTNGENLIIGLHISPEINFIRNNGRNNYIPGVDLALSYTYADIDDVDPHAFGVSGSVFLKVFVSDNIALIPKLGLGYSSVIEDPTARLAIALRNYF